MQQLGQPMIRLRADHDVDERSPLEQGLALGLGHTTCDADQHVHSARAPALAQTPQATELGVYLLRGFLPDVARVQNDEIGVIGALGGDIAVRRQRIRHSGGIIHVHLAAVGLDEQLLGHASAATSPEITCGYGQTGTRSATCHADRLALPHDILMGIRKDRVKRPGGPAKPSSPVRAGATLPENCHSRTGRGEERQALGGAPSMAQVEAQTTQRHGAVPVTSPWRRQQCACEAQSQQARRRVAQQNRAPAQAGRAGPSR